MPVSSSEPDRRAVVHGLLAVTGLTALGACGGAPGSAPPRSSPVAETASPSRAPGTGDPGAIETPETSATSPSPEPGTPSRDEIVAEFTGRAPAWFDLVGEGIASDTRAAGVCLTLDACGGPGGSGADTALVDMLIGDSVPFTAFLNSRWVEANPDLTDRLAACETVEIANHGTAHLPMSVTGAAAYGIPGTRDAGEVWDEIMGNQVALTERTGRAPRFFRPGTAHWDDVALAIAARLGLRAAGFSVNGDGGATFPAGTVEAEVRRASAGDIVISHMNQPAADTGAGYLAAVPAMLAEGTVFLTLSDASAAG
mgnify:CR=1 FL=1